MRVLYFDCFSGISGDMTLGALLDIGVDKEQFKSELDKLNLSGYEITIQKTIKNGITGTDVNVVLNEDCEEHRNSIHEHEHHENAHHHVHDHVHKTHAHSTGARNLKDIEVLIEFSDLKPSVKSFSIKVFREIAKAEAKVHNKDINEVHFHEVGAVDSIVDIVGTAICLDLLGIERVFSSPVHDGTGFINCQHGMLPVPVPAVMEMLVESKIPYISEDINTELVTPTGMGIIKCLATSYGRMPAMIIEKIGYGMGKRETGRLNALRVVMGTLFEEDYLEEEISVLETNIDDMTPEAIGYTVESLLEKGALDVFTSPIYMKKNRSAVMLTVLAAKDKEKELVNVLFKETSTLGVRVRNTVRYCMDRKMVKVDTEYGEVRVKVASSGDIVKFAPEYEDCREIAKRSGLPIRNVYDLVNEKSKYLI